MQHNSNHNSKKESFKLLQLSDDSKSLSDLELSQVHTTSTVILPQRKRKILRKTRNTSPHSARLAAVGGHFANGNGHQHAHDAATSADGLISGACSANFGLWIAVVMTCGWLFILSYMTAVVYSENRRLEAQLFKLQASSQTVPDELQRWHESAKWLAQNQTLIVAQLAAANRSSVALAQDVRALRAEFKRTYDDSSDHEKVIRLQTNVANLGAQLKDLTIDVTALKDRTVAMHAEQDAAGKSLLELGTFVHAAANRSTADGGSPFVDRAPLTNATVLWLVHNVTDATQSQVHQFAVDLDSLRYSNDQRADGLKQDVRQQKSQLDALTENYANLTAHVVSIENSIRGARLANVTGPSAVTVAPGAASAGAQAKPLVTAGDVAAVLSSASPALAAGGSARTKMQNFSDPTLSETFGRASDPR